MLFGLPISDLLIFAGVMGLGALIAGFIAGLFGVGGGIVMVPVLTELFSLGIGGSDPALSQHMAVGTSLAIIIPTSIRSARTHYDSGVMDMALLKSYLITIPLGVVLGLFLALYLDASALGFVFGAIALFVGIYQLFASPNFQLGTQLPGSPVREIAGGFIGTSSTLMGIGGGVVNNLYMSLNGADIKRAIATSAGVGVLISIPAALGFVIIGLGVENKPPFSLGYVNLLALAFMIPFTLIMAPIGARLTHRLPSKTTKRLFSCFLILVALRAFWKVFAG